MLDPESPGEPSKGAMIVVVWRLLVLDQTSFTLFAAGPRRLVGKVRGRLCSSSKVGVAIEIPLKKSGLRDGTDVD